MPSLNSFQRPDPVCYTQPRAPFVPISVDCDFVGEYSESYPGVAFWHIFFLAFSEQHWSSMEEKNKLYQAPELS